MSWASEIYEVDRKAAEICRDMTITGIAFDRERAGTLAASLLAIEQGVRAQADANAGRPIRRTKGGGFGMTGGDGLEAAFFQWLRAPVYFRSSLTRRPSLGIDALRGYAACADPRLSGLALNVIDWRRARKLRRTYVEGVTIEDDGRVHPGWKNYGAVSGRWSCRKPNLMNLPRRSTDPTAGLGGIRSQYIAHLPGHEQDDCTFVIFDMKQLEMRVAAYASGDSAMIAACESKDLHAANAKIIFGSAFEDAASCPLKGSASHVCERCDLYEKLRTCAKTSGFAVAYLAEAATVFARLIADGLNVTLREVEQMLRRMRREFHAYYEWQERRLYQCIKYGWVDEPVSGRRRWLGHAPEATACANFPIQGGAAAIMNLRVPEVVSALRARRVTARLVAQVHDSCAFECRKDDAPEVSDICRTAMQRAIRVGDRDAEFPIDLKVSSRLG